MLIVASTKEQGRVRIGEQGVVLADSCRHNPTTGPYPYPRIAQRSSSVKHGMEQSQGIELTGEQRSGAGSAGVSCFFPPFPPTRFRSYIVFFFPPFDLVDVIWQDENAVEYPPDAPPTRTPSHAKAPYQQPSATPGGGLSPQSWQRSPSHDRGSFER